MAQILVIDDEEPFRTMLREVLEREGHAVMEAGDGREGITLARNIPIDLIITDLLMPELDGLEVIQTLRSDSPQVKIIAISGDRGSARSICSKLRSCLERRAHSRSPLA
jgi:CheY-like chemotaxis protein